MEVFSSRVVNEEVKGQFAGTWAQSGPTLTSVLMKGRTTEWRHGFYSWVMPPQLVEMESREKRRYI